MKPVIGGDIHKLTADITYVYKCIWIGVLDNYSHMCKFNDDVIL